MKFLNILNVDVELNCKNEITTDGYYEDTNTWKLSIVYDGANL